MRFSQISIEHLMTRLSGSGLKRAKIIGDDKLLVTTDASLPKVKLSHTGENERISTADIMITDTGEELSFRIEHPDAGEVMHPNWDGAGYWRDPKTASFRLLDEGSFCGILDRMIGSLNFREGCWSPENPINRNAAAWCRKNLPKTSGIRIKSIGGKGVTVNSVSRGDRNGAGDPNGAGAAGSAVKKPVLHITARKPAGPSENERNDGTVRSEAGGKGGVRVISINCGAYDNMSADSLTSLADQMRIKAAADIFVRAVMARRREVVVGNVDFSELCAYVHINCPELYELNMLDYRVSSGGSTMTIYIDYRLGAEETASIRERTNAAIKKVAEEAAKRPAGAEQLRYIYNYISSHAVYTPNKPYPWYSYSAAGFFLHRSAVCSGFAKAYMLIAKELGYNVGYVIGYLSRDSEVTHAWNIVELNGFTYHIDVTSGVVLYTGEHVCALPCFLATTEELRRERIFKTPFREKDDPRGGYLAQMGCGFSTQGELIRLLRDFDRSDQPVITLQAAPMLIGTDRLERMVPPALATIRCGARCTHFANGTFILIKDGAKGFGKPIKIKKISMT